MWSEEIVEQMTLRNWDRDAWDNEIEIDYDAVLDFGAESKPVPPPTLTVPDGVRVNIAAQANDGPEETFEMLSMHIGDMVRRHETALKQVSDILHDHDKHFLAHDERLNALEVAVFPPKNVGEPQAGPSKLEEQPPKLKEQRFPCSQCDIVCHSKDRLANHKKEHVSASLKGLAICVKCGVSLLAKNLAKHEEKCVTPESAISTDFVSDVKQAPFLGKRSSSQRKSYKPSPKNSTLKTKKDQFQLLQETLCNMMVFQKDIVNLLKKQQQPTGGPGLEAQQS